jgi:hypothetical protein
LEGKADRQVGQLPDYLKRWAIKDSLDAVSHCDTVWCVNSRQRKTFAAIFDDPVRSGIKWTDIESLFGALGAELSEGRGSRVRIALNGVRMVFHRPHPEPTTDRGAVKSVRRFLTEAGVTP